MFDELLAIKRFREGQAELAVVRQRQIHADAEQARLEAERALEQFRQWALRRELEMYGDLCARTVRVREIEDVLQGVAGLRDGERQRETEVAEAGEKVTREAQSLADTRLRHREASRMTEKFVELAQVHLAELAKDLERKEDLEMEEAASVARDRDDWEHHEEYEPA